MTQYPFPTPPPQGPLGPMGFAYYQPAATSRPSLLWARILMFIMCAAFLVCGGFTTVAAFNWEELMHKAGEVYGPQFTEQMQERMNSQGSTPQQIKTGLTAVGVVTLVAGVAFFFLAIFLGRGLGVIITSIVLASLVTLGSLCIGVMGMAANASEGPAGILGGCMLLLPLVLCIPLLISLIMAARASSRLQQQAQLARMWQMQQHAAQQQAAQQQAPPQQWPAQQAPSPQGYGYGYGAAIPAPPPPVSNQSPQNQAPPGPQPGETDGPRQG